MVKISAIFLLNTYIEGFVMNFASISYINLVHLYIELFRERLSEKLHVTIPKSIVGGFECTVCQRNLKEWHGRPTSRNSRRYLVISSWVVN